MNALKSFILISRLEGLSFLLLLGVAMPLKYLSNMPAAVQYVGWAHGILFMAYLMVLAIAARQNQWKISTVALAGLASLLPFGPFLFERRFLKKMG